MINKPFFFNQVKQHLFGGSFTQKQVNGLNAILTEWEAKLSKSDDRFLAYMLATVHHETDKQMQPIEEYGKGKGRDYGKKLKMGRGPGRRIAYTSPNQLYYGRGYVQLTWYENYEKAAKELKVDCLVHPELTLDLSIATKIMFAGMMKGWFTGKKLGDYFNKTKEDWVNARRIINGMDKAQLIKDYAIKYYAAISYTV